MITSTTSKRSQTYPLDTSLCHTCIEYWKHLLSNIPTSHSYTSQPKGMIITYITPYPITPIPKPPYPKEGLFSEMLCTKEETLCTREETLRTGEMLCTREETPHNYNIPTSHLYTSQTNRTISLREMLCTREEPPHSYN